MTSSETVPMRQVSRVVVVGPTSWNTIVRLPRLPDPRPQTVFAAADWTGLGGTSAGKALHLAELGIPVTLSTVLGGDADADLIRGALAHDGIEVVAECVEGPSERHLNLMADGARLSIYLSLPQPPGTPLPAATRTAIESAEHVVLDLSLRTRDAIPSAGSSAAAIWTDLHDYDGESAYHQPFLDAADHIFLSDDALGDPRPLMSRLARLGKRLVVCTLGPRGAIALDANGWHQVTASPARVVDTNGAGDAFFAGFLAATMGAAQIDEALRAAAAQAARAVASHHLSPLLDRPHRA